MFNFQITVNASGNCLIKRKTVPIDLNRLTLLCLVFRHLNVSSLNSAHNLSLANYRGNNSHSDLEKFFTAFTMNLEFPVPWNQELHHLYLFRQNFRKQVQAMEDLKAEILQTLA